ncbi:uncharacterized protein CCR75_001504 [Bremia lactucae]|uniref:CBS domain-containing protein n=1 Tax=Bremia lactucae TaxID=4779 RepID=A0A976FG33_BRELC|nr:hypothetical protein CCR75_001504 [Bremia lactucae]
MHGAVSDVVWDHAGRRGGNRFTNSRPKFVHVTLNKTHTTGKIMLCRLLRVRGARAVPTTTYRSLLQPTYCLRTDPKRWRSYGTSTTVSTATNESTTEIEATDVDPMDRQPSDFGSPGVETAKVLTIADVLHAREHEWAQNKALVDFDEWESIAATDTVHDAVLAMVERKIGSLIVTEPSKGIVGIVTERDILKKVAPRSIMTEEKLVRDVMSSHLICIQPNITVLDALATMIQENIRHLAVVHGDMTRAVKRGSVQEEDMRCVLSMMDIVRAYAELKGAAPVPADTLLNHLKTDEVTSKENNPTDKTRVENDVLSNVTAAMLLKKKHQRIKLLLNTRPEDHVTVAAAVEAMATRDFGAVLVVDKDQHIVGIFTEREYLSQVLYPVKDPTMVLVTDVMTTSVSVLQTDDSLEKCWNVARTSHCRHFPVLGVVLRPTSREKELAGILSIKDIVREMAKDHATTRGFRLMEFLKSTMEMKRIDSKPSSTDTLTTHTDTHAPKHDKKPIETHPSSFTNEASTVRT